MNLIEQHFHDSTTALASLQMNPLPFEALEEMGRCICAAFRNGRKVLICGNGGSAADAQHIAAELVVRYKTDRKAYPVIALTTDTSILTAAGNDYSFSDIFSRQVEALGQGGDILIAISTSGMSDNVLQAVNAANKRGMKVFAFTGNDPSPISRRADYKFMAGRSTAITQQLHMVALHAMCDFIEHEMNP